MNFPISFYQRGEKKKANHLFPICSANYMRKTTSMTWFKLENSRQQNLSIIHIYVQTEFSLKKLSNKLLVIYSGSAPGNKTIYSLLFLISELRKLNLIRLKSIKRLRSILSWNEFEEHNEWQIEKNYIYVYISFKNQFLQQVNYGYDLTYSEVSDSNFGTIADESSIWDARTAPISCSGNSSGVLP